MSPGEVILPNASGGEGGNKIVDLRFLSSWALRRIHGTIKIQFLIKQTKIVSYFDLFMDSSLRSE